MKKQTYVQPAVEVIELEVSSVLCGSPINEDTNNVEDESGVDCQSTGNRWGSIFDPSSEEK